MSTQVQTVDTRNFEQAVLQSERPVLVDFYADWCGPCKLISPVLAELARDFDGRVEIRKVDVDANPGLAAQYGVRGVPTLVLFQAGKAREKLVGLRARGEIKALLQSAA